MLVFMYLQPVPGLENPYAKPQKRCILCVHNVDLDYKVSVIYVQSLFCKFFLISFWCTYIFVLLTSDTYVA